MNEFVPLSPACKPVNKQTKMYSVRGEKEKKFNFITVCYK